MRVDVKKSVYHEVPDAEEHWTTKELRRLRQVLRRLRFLEAMVRERGGMSDPDSGGAAAYVELEIEGLELVLLELEYIEIKQERK